MPPRTPSPTPPHGTTPPRPRTPPHPERALVLSGLAVIAVTYGLARYGYGLYLPQFRAAFGLSAGTAGAIAAGGYVGYCGAAVLAARLIGAGRGRTALWSAGGSAALGCLLVAAAWNGASLAVGALVAGSGAGAATPAMVAAVASTVRPETERRSQGVVNSGTGLGVVAGGLLVLAVPGAWRSSWVAFAVLALGLTAWADRSARWAPAPADGPRAEVGADPHLLRLLARPLLAAVVAGAGCAAVWTFGRDLLAGAGGLPDRVSGLLWCLLGGAGLLGGVSGVLVGRIGLRAAWMSTVVVAGAGTVMLAAVPARVLPAAAALTCFGAAFVALSGVLIAWGADRDPAAAPAAAAAVSIGLTIGQGTGSVLLGAVAEAGTARTAFGVAALLLLVSVAAAEPRAGGARRRRSRASGEAPGVQEPMV